MAPEDNLAATSPEVAPRLWGSVVYLYAFDVANEVQLDRAAELLAAKSAPVPRQDRPAPREVPLTRPLTVELSSTAHLNGSPISVTIRIFDVGVVSLTIQVPFAKDSLAELIPYHAPILADGQPLDEFARQQCEEIRIRLADALVRPGLEMAPEAYTVFCLTRLGDVLNANQWLADHQRDVAGLLTQTPGDRLSDTQTAEVLRLRRSFENTDLVIIDWDAALVVDLEGSVEDELHVLELANLQLEEFRWMDRALDRYLERAYSDLGQRRWWPIGAAAGVLRNLRQLRIDLTKLADEVMHITKFVGDWHLARVYVLARERFHLDQWRASVDQRLAELDRLYTMTRGDQYDRRMLWLEVVIVVFFAVDLLILLMK